MMKQFHRIILIFFLSSTLFAASEHPFLLVNKSEYDELRSRQTEEPWSKMISSAKTSFASLKPINITTDAMNSCSYRIRDLLDVGSLLYIVDPDNQQTYLPKMRDFILDMEELQNHSGYGSGWFGTVTVGMAQFMAVIAYDIIYDDLTDDERSAIEKILHDVALDFYGDKRFNGSHHLNYTGAAGVWFLFKNDSRKNTMITKYRSTFDSYINELGVWCGSLDYSFARMSSVRYSKAFFMDVLQHTGEMNFYDEPRHQQYYEFIYSFAMAPNGDAISIGDSHVKKAATSPGIFLTKKMTDQAAAVAAWRIDLNKFTNRPGLINYVLMDKPHPTPLAPTSKIYEDGGAFFIEANANKNSFYGALWNPKQDNEGHIHKEVNALHLAAYGEHILRNAGYNGWGKGVDPFTWDDINNRAWTANTVMHLDRDHSSKKGYGIKEAFTNTTFDYACGHSGRAISNGIHLRSLLMVHPQDDANGYYVVFDELENISSTKEGFVTVNMHPNSDEAQVIEEGVEYQWEIKPHRRSANRAHVNIFLVTEPDKVELGESPFATSGENFIGEYLKYDYAIGAKETRNIVSIIYPHDKNHAVAKMRRLSGEGFSAAEIIVNETTKDYAFADAQNIEIEHEGASINLNALFSLYRIGEQNFYFVRQGTQFQDVTNGRGFLAEAPISIYAKGDVGSIVSPGTPVTFYYPDITGIQIGGVMANKLDSGENWIKVDVQKGTFDIEFKTGAAAVKNHNSIQPQEFSLDQNYPNPFNPSTTIDYRIMRQKHVNISIYNMRGQKVKTLVNEMRAAGSHSITWNGHDEFDQTVPSGVYMYKLVVNGQNQTRKMLLMQ